MKLTYKSNLGKLRSRLAHLKTLPQQGRTWTEESAQEFDKNLRDHLATQGRGKHPPPLTSATLQIYKIDGQPDGSGIRDHLTSFQQHSANQSIAGIGIPPGKPTIVAKVQDGGKTIRVTAKMRGWLAYRGIFLKSTTQAIRIPARKFWQKSWAKTKRDRLRELRKLLHH